MGSSRDGWRVGCRAEGGSINGLLMRGSILTLGCQVDKKHQVSQRHCYHVRATDVPPASSMMRPNGAKHKGRQGNTRVYWGDGEVMWER